MKSKRTKVVAALVAVGILLCSSAAFGTSTLQVDGTTTPPGAVAVTGNSATNTSFLTNFGIPMRCAGSSIAGYVNRGVSVTAGTQIGAISAMAYSSCTMTTLNYPVVMVKTSVPTDWPIMVRNTPSSASQNTIDVTIVGAQINVRSTGSAPYACHFQTLGNVNATFNRVTQQLTIVTAPAMPLNLTAYDSTGSTGPSNILPPGSGTCIGWVETGDTASMSGAFNVYTPGVGGIHLN